MNNFDKLPLNNDIGFRIGYIYKLTGKIGYVTDTKEFQQFVASMKTISEEFKSEVIALDITELTRWDTLSLRAIFPVLIAANKELKTKGKALISVIGDQSKDVFDAASERYPENGTLIPWYSSLSEFRRSQRV